MKCYFEKPSNAKRLSEGATVTLSMKINEDLKSSNSGKVKEFRKLRYLKDASG